MYTRRNPEVKKYKSCVVLYAAPPPCTFARGGGISFMGFRLVTSARCGGGFFAGFASGFRWCLAVLSRSPGGCCFGRVWARLRCVLCPRAGACFFSFMGFRLVTSARCGGGFFAGFASGFRWCLAVLSRSPAGCCFGRVWARLRCVLCPRAGACFFSFMGFRLVTSARCGGGFFAGFASGFRWCLAVLSLGCVAFCVHAQPSPDTPKTATCRRSTQNSQTPPKSGRKPSKKPSPAACRSDKSETHKGEETGPSTWTQNATQPRLKTAKHHLNPDANPAKNPPPQRAEVTSLKPIKEKKQAPARGHKTQRNLAQTRPKQQPPGDRLKTAKHHLNPDANPAKNPPPQRAEVTSLKPIKGGCCFGRVWARLRCVLCPRAGACFFSFMGFRLVTSARCGGGFFAGFASAFRWCLAVLSRSPGGCCFGRVWARLRCVLCPRAGAC